MHWTSCNLSWTSKRLPPCEQWSSSGIVEHASQHCPCLWTSYQSDGEYMAHQISSYVFAVHVEVDLIIRCYYLFLILWTVDETAAQFESNFSLMLESIQRYDYLQQQCLGFIEKSKSQLAIDKRADEPMTRRQKKRNKRRQRQRHT